MRPLAIFLALGFVVTSLVALSQDNYWASIYYLLAAIALPVFLLAMGKRAKSKRDNRPG